MGPLKKLTLVLLLTTQLGLAYGAEQGVPLATAPVRYQEVVREQVFDGVLEAVNQTTVSAQTSGRIVEINYDVDDFVSKDSVIMRFRDKEQRAALVAAEARYEEAGASFKRVEELIAKKLVSQSDYDRAEAALKAARANLEQAQEQLEHTVVRAPYSGIVVKRHVEKGELASPGTPLITGLSLEHLRATANVSQTYINKLREYARARVIVAHDDVKSIEADSLTISPYADPVAHTFKVRVDLQAGQHGLYPGMFVKVAFVVGEQRRLVAPAAAIVYRSEVTGVYVISETGQVSFRRVRVARVLDDGNVEVLAGLAEGEQVALEPIRAGAYLKQLRAGGGK